MNNPNKKKKKVSPKLTADDTTLVHYSSTPETTDDSKLIYVGGLVGCDESKNQRKTFKQFRQEMKESSLNNNRQLLYNSTTRPLQKEQEDLLEEEIRHIINTEWSTLPETLEKVFEEHTFYIFRTDTNDILAQNVQGFEQAKKRATELRKSLKLKWDQVKFKSEKRKSNFGVSNSGATYTDSFGNKTKVQYARNYNPSKRRHFRGGINSDGTSFDID